VTECNSSHLSPTLLTLEEFLLWPKVFKVFKF
jgi:hypothetical protein